MSRNELDAKVAELRELRRMAEELTAEITAAEDDLKAYMTASRILFCKKVRKTPVFKGKQGFSWS